MVELERDEGQELQELKRIGGNFARGVHSGILTSHTVYDHVVSCEYVTQHRGAE